MNLYNLRSIAPGCYQMAKFDKDFNVEAVYDIVQNRGDYSCNCPANNRSVIISRCKHRKMMPYMLGAVDTSRFYDPETHTWHQPIEVAPEQAEHEAAQVANLPPVVMTPQATVDPIERIEPGYIAPPVTQADITVFPECPKPFETKPASGLRRRV